MYGESTDIIDDILNSQRKLIEECDNLQGFIFNFSLMGGKGSGLSSLILLRIKDYYPDKYFYLSVC